MHLNIQITDQEARTILDRRYAQLTVDFEAVNGLLKQCVAVMTPEQMQQCGLSVTTPPASDEQAPTGAPAVNGKAKSE